jgi:hypothetical protein
MERGFPLALGGQASGPTDEKGAVNIIKGKRNADKSVTNKSVDNRSPAKEGY